MEKLEIQKDIDSSKLGKEASIPTQNEEEQLKPILTVKGINKAFPTAGGPVPVLNNISFDIKPGSFNIIFGPSGSGKTTILNTILGLEEPDEGEVNFYDQNIYELSQDEMSQFRAHRYGVVYQTSNWVESLNVIENVALPLLFMGIKEDWCYQKARENLDLVGMADFANRNPKTLSGGQQQRVSLARSLINNPWIIVADEPTGNLDSKSGNQVMQLLYDLSKKYKRTIVLVTHNMDYVILASQMIYIKDGRLSSREEALPQPIKINL